MAQLNLFRAADCDRHREKVGSPKPDAHGLFSIRAVTDIAYRRGCVTKKLSALAIRVTGTHRGNPTTAMLTATRPGKWDPVAMIRACSEANGLRVFEVDMRTAKPTNPCGLDEITIARIIAADGTRPYLSRPSPHLMGRGSGIGEPTWAMRMVLLSEDGRKLFANHYAWRRAVRTLQDCGLMDVRLGKHGGLSTAVCTWTKRAYLPPPVPRRDTTLGVAEDDYALACIAGGIPMG